MKEESEKDREQSRSTGKPLCEMTKAQSANNVTGNLKKKKKSASKEEFTCCSLEICYGTWTNNQG